MLMLTDGNIDNASARIRAIQYIPYFESIDYCVAHIPRVSTRPFGLISKYSVYPVLKRWYRLKIALSIIFRKWDLVFIQRIFISENLLKMLHSRSIPVIFDFDDAIYINPRNPSHLQKAVTMVKWSNQVIVSTEYLKVFCLKNGKTAEVIVSPVETDRIYPMQKTHNQIVTIGWIGSPWTSGFLEIVEKPLKRLAEKYEFRFLTIGARPEYKIEGVNHETKPWIFEDENEVIGQMDIGIMPLPDTEFARMKGGYKLLQYLSAGIPCVASAVGINQSIVKPGDNGYLASSDEEWFDALEKLMLDPKSRLEMGINGRKDAVELYSREVCFEKINQIANKL